MTADWDKVRNRYINTDISMKRLAEDEGLSYATLRARANREHWADKRAAKKNARLERVKEKLLKKIESAIDGSKELDSKEIKAMTGALKELIELNRPEGESAGEKRLEVCFIGETEELSR